MHCIQYTILHCKLQNILLKQWFKNGNPPYKSSWWSHLLGVHKSHKCFFELLIDHQLRNSLKRNIAHNIIMLWWFYKWILKWTKTEMNKTWVYAFVRNDAEKIKLFFLPPERIFNIFLKSFFFVCFKFLFCLKIVFLSFFCLYDLRTR